MRLTLPLLHSASLLPGFTPILHNRHTRHPTYNFSHCDNTDGATEHELRKQHDLSVGSTPTASARGLLLSSATLSVTVALGPRRAAPHDRLHSGGRPTMARGSTCQPPLHQPLTNWRLSGFPPMTRITLSTLCSRHIATKQWLYWSG
jgi:hypothetical protein